MKPKITLFIVATFSIAMLQGCGGNEAKNEISTATAVEKKAQVEKSSSGRFQNKGVSFKINDVEAFRALDRSDKPIAQLNAVNDNLSLTMHGDIADGVLQGMLSIRKMPFTKTTGELTGVKATYIRYFDERGGRSISYSSSNFTLTLNKCEKLPNGPLGEEWMLSGTFSGKLKVSPYEEAIAAENNTDKELNFTEGKFENIKMVILGAHLKK